jgi:hypothetical protein
MMKSKRLQEIAEFEKKFLRSSLGRHAQVDEGEVQNVFDVCQSASYRLWVCSFLISEVLTKNALRIANECQCHPRKFLALVIHTFESEGTEDGKSAPFYNEWPVRLSELDFLDFLYLFSFENQNREESKTRSKLVQQFKFDRGSE